MRIVRDTEQEFVVGENSVFFRALLAVGLVLVAAAAGLYSLADHPNPERLKGLVVGAGLLVLMFFIFYEKNTFVFDRNGSWLRWSKWHIFRRKEGQLPFTQIENVVLQSQKGNNGGRAMQRVVVVTTEGELPLSVGYTPGETNQTIARRLREILSQAPGNLNRDSVLEMVRQGRRVDAVRFLREQEGLSLDQAVARVDSIVGDKTGPGPK